ncbi:MAG: ATP-binding protein [Candidatus Omnitrophica bacterium]|nr:ATP-binding protein [Candidatus Omnitrophota bacterium]
MARLKLENIFSGLVAQKRFLLRPAEPDVKDLMPKTYQGIYLGRTQNLSVPVFWDYDNLTNPHLAVVGMTGSGKSFFIKTFITRAYKQWGTSSIILDWSGEYTPWVKKAGGNVYTISKDCTINILALDSKKGISKKEAIRTKIQRLLSSFSLLCGFSPKQQSILKKALEKVYNKKKTPSISDLVLALSKLKESKKDEDLEFLLLQIEKFKLSSNKLPEVKLDDFIKKGLVSVDLSQLDSEEHRSLIALLILQYIKEQMRLEGLADDKKIKLIVVADEAWKIAQDDRSDLVKILREGRKYAFSIIVASQNPSDISPTILSNAATLAVFRLMHADFRDTLIKSLNCPKEVSIQIEKFKVGQALFRLAWAIPSNYDGPFIISRIEGEVSSDLFFLLVNDMEVSIEREVLAAKLFNLGCTNSQTSQLIKAFEENDKKLSVEVFCRVLLSFGISRSIVINLLRDFGLKDEDLVNVFARLEASSLNVPPSKLANLVIKDD